MRIATSLFVFMIAGPAFGQFAQDQRLEAPKTPAEFWNAINFELNTGKYDTAAFYLKGMLAANPQDQDLVELEQKEGLAAFLRLRNISKWSADAKTNDEARKNAEELITKVNAALEKLLGSPQRITRLIAGLRGTAEERAYATVELQRFGSRAVPALVASLRGAADATQQATILNVFPLLREETVGPLLASLDMKDGRLRYQILQSIGQRPDFPYLTAQPQLNPLPTLDYLHAAANQPEDVRQLARSLIQRARPIGRGEIRAGKIELTEAAMRFHHHQLRFVQPDAVPIWRWENEELVLTPSNTTQAEEYLGLRYARWALELDPDYLPAQVAFLSIAADKAYGRVGLAAELEKAEPPVHDLLATAGTTALLATLDQAMIDRRTTVALAVTRTFGERADVKAAEPGLHKAGALERALEFADPRVQMAAAAALVRIPGPFAQQNQTRIVEVLRGMLASESVVAPATQPRIIVGHFDAAKGLELANMFQKAGYDVISVRTGREVLARLRKAADIDAIAVDSELPYPPLPDLLASLRSDNRTKALPVRVIYMPDGPAFNPSAAMVRRLGRSTPQTAAIRESESWQALDAENRVYHLTENLPHVALISGPLTPGVLQASLVQGEKADGSAVVSPEERKRFALQAIELFRQLALERPAIDLKSADRVIRQALKNDNLAPAAVDVVGRLPGRDAQADLAALVADAKRKPELRLAAAKMLAVHVQKYGPALPPATVAALVKLASSAEDGEFRGHVAALAGVLTGEGKTTGLRLEQYQPPKPGAAPAAKPQGKPGEKKPEPGDDDK